MRCTRTSRPSRRMSERRFVGEIVPLQLAGDGSARRAADVPDIDDLAALAPLVPPDGTHTSGNTSPLHDGAAMAVIVSAQVHAELGAPARPAAGRQRTQGVGAGEEARAPVAALEKLLGSQRRLHARELGAGRDVGDLRRAGPGAARCLRARRRRAEPRRRRPRARPSAGCGRAPSAWCACSRGMVRAPQNGQRRRSAPSPKAPSAASAWRRCSRRSRLLLRRRSNRCHAAPPPLFPAICRMPRVGMCHELP